MFLFVIFFLCKHRHEVKALKRAHTSSNQSNNGNGDSAAGIHTSGVSNKDRLTVDWFSKVITEFRAELSDLQEAQNNTTRRMQQRSNCAEDLMELRDDFDKLKLEWNAMRLRQDNIEQAIKELQAEAIQRDDDFRRSQIQVSEIKRNK